MALQLKNKDPLVLSIQRSCQQKQVVIASQTNQNQQLFGYTCHQQLSVGSQSQTIVINGKSFTKTVTITENVNNPLQCAYCTKTYVSTQGLRVHVKNHHSKKQYAEHCKKFKYSPKKKESKSNCICCFNPPY